jgi:hypothetical protein
MGHITTTVTSLLFSCIICSFCRIGRSGAHKPIVDASLDFGLPFLAVLVVLAVSRLLVYKDLEKGPLLQPPIYQ